MNCFRGCMTCLLVTIIGCVLYYLILVGIIPNASLAISDCWSSIRNELQLQYQCHLNESHQAYENARLNLRVDECIKREDDCEKRLRQSKTAVDQHHYGEKRNFLEGIFYGMAFLTIYSVFIGILVAICCCGVFHKLPHLRPYGV